MKSAIFPIFGILLLCTLTAAQDSKNAAKLTVEEVVAKHLASIGTPEDIAAAKTRVLVGTGRLSGKTTAGFADGRVQIASSGNSVLFAMVFDNHSHPYEKIAYDGKDVSFAKIPPGGARSALGEFIRLQNAVITEGLFTGVLSSAWPLLDITGKKVKLSYAGTEEMSGQKFHKLKYNSRTGDLTISLYFDATNFHHVVTEYKFSIEIGASANSTIGTGRKVQRITLIEQYSNFKNVGKLNLPFNYSINFTQTIEDKLFSYDWKLNILDIYLNETLSPEVFKAP